MDRLKYLRLLLLRLGQSHDIAFDSLGVSRQNRELFELFSRILEIDRQNGELFELVSRILLWQGLIFSDIRERWYCPLTVRLPRHHGDVVQLMVQS